MIHALDWMEIYLPGTGSLERSDYCLDDMEAAFNAGAKYATAAEQVRVLEAVRWAFAAYNGDLDKISEHCFGMSFGWTHRLRDEELDRVREEARKAEQERWKHALNTIEQQCRGQRVAAMIALWWLREAVGETDDD